MFATHASIRNNRFLMHCYAESFVNCARRLQPVFSVLMRQRARRFSYHCRNTRNPPLRLSSTRGCAAPKLPTCLLGNDLCTDRRGHGLEDRQSPQFSSTAPAHRGDRKGTTKYCGPPAV